MSDLVDNGGADDTDDDTTICPPPNNLPKQLNVIWDDDKIQKVRACFSS